MGRSVLLGAFVCVVGYVFYAMYPDMMRYIKMKQM